MPASDMFMNIYFKGVCFSTQKSIRIMNNNGGIVFVSAACKAATEVFAR
jgi:hypothetical protein